MLIAQISDLHCREAGSKASLSCDNNHNVSLAVGRLNGLSPRPDLVIATGDLTSAGRHNQYSALSTLLEPLEIPLYLLPGNHDEREAMLDVFSGQYGLVNDKYDFVTTVIDNGPLRLVALDTTVEGHHQGAVPEDRANWLDGILGAKPMKPTLIFMHHPPFETGIWWMDSMGILKGLDLLAEVLVRHSQVIGITTGHLHRNIHATFSGIPVTVCPTTCYAVDLDINDEAMPRVTNEPPAMMLHYWHRGTLVSHSLFLNACEVHDVTSLMKDWPERFKRMQRRQPLPKELGQIE